MNDAVLADGEAVADGLTIHLTSVCDSAKKLAKRGLIEKREEASTHIDK